MMEKKKDANVPIQENPFFKEYMTNPYYKEFTADFVEVKDTKVPNKKVIVFKDTYEIPIVGIALTTTQVKALAEILSKIQ